MGHAGTAFITGASSGIGAAFARKLAANGHNLVLHGRREVALAELSASLGRKHGVRAEYFLAELSDPAELARLEERLRAVGDLAILVNNAGFGSQRAFQDDDVELHERMIRVHVLAPVRLTHAAIPALKRRGGGAIINVSSVASFLISPKNNTYCATKLYLNSFSESLACELRGDGIRVQALCPGFTTTDFHRRLGIDAPTVYGMKFMDADRVVGTSLRSLRRGVVICIPGLRYKLAAFAPRFIPRRLLYRLVRRFG
jgi:short-subunit dehydrogenase